MSNSQFWESVCRHEPIVVFLIAINATLATVLVGALLLSFVSIGTVSASSATVALLTFAILGVSTAFMGYVLVRCRRFDDVRTTD